MGRSQDAFFVLPEVFPLLPLDLVHRGRLGESLVACSVRASSFRSPQFIRGLGILELLSLSELQLLLCPNGSSSSSLYVRRGDGVGE